MGYVSHDRMIDRSIWTVDRFQQGYTNCAGVKKNNDSRRIIIGGHFSTKRNDPLAEEKLVIFEEKSPRGQYFCLLYMKKKDPRKKLPLP